MREGAATAQPGVRARLENSEALLLAAWAQKSAQTRGRERVEARSPVRTEYQRDRDRVLHSNAFRRLKHKTQVFIAPRGEHYATRLTHALEVAQIARTVCRALSLNEDLAEAIALAHDLGHAPFGHAGQSALDGVHPGGFRHNEQSLRVVEVLEKDGQGLNLTWEVRDGIRTHRKPRSSIAGVAVEPSSTLEAEAVKLSDGIAYINHDIDDAIRAEVIQPQDLPDAPSAVLGHTRSERINSLVLDIIDASSGHAAVEMSRAVLEATDDLRAFLFERVYLSDIVKSEWTRAHNVVTRLYEHFERYPDQMPPGFRSGSGSGSSQAVCDYIAGMTDQFALQTFDAVFVPRMWSS
jgi:dGTPase